MLAYELTEDCTMPNPTRIEFIDLHEVSRRVGLKKSAIYKMVRLSGFPRPVKLGAKAIRWSAAEVERWQAERLAERAA